MSFYDAPFLAAARETGGEYMESRLWCRLRNGQNRITHSAAISDASWTKTLVVLASTGPAKPAVAAETTRVVRSTSGAAEALISSPLTATLREAQGRFIMAVVAVSYYNHGAFRVALVDLVGNEYWADFTWSAGTAPVVSGQHATVNTVTVLPLTSPWYLVAVAVDATASGLHNLSWRCRTYPAYGTFSPSGIGLYQANAGVEQQPTAAPASTVTVTTDAHLLNQPGTLLCLTDLEPLISCNPIRTEREWLTGATVAQNWQVELANDTLAIGDLGLHSGWVAAQGVFPEAGASGLLAQGRVSRIQQTPTGTVLIEVHDQLQEAMGQKLAHDYAVTSTGWCGMIKADVIGDGSSTYDNDWDGDGVDEGPELVLPAAMADGVFRIVFTSATVFKVVHPSGAEQTGFGIGADADIRIGALPGPSPVMIRIKAGGWSGGTFAAGDIFKFGTARAWTSLNPLYVAFYLMNDLMRLRPYDVLAGDWYGYGMYDVAGWLAAMPTYTSSTVGGEWPEGTDIMRIVETVLATIHASVFTMPTGQIGLYELLPNAAPAYVLNGDRGAGLPVTILEPVGIDESGARPANRVTYKYLTLAGKEASVTVEDQDAIDGQGRKDMDVDLRPLRVDAATIEAAANKMLNRRKAARVTYSVRGDLAAAVLDINQPIAIRDSFMGLNLVKVEIDSREVDVDSNEASVTAYIDPVTLQNYFRVGDAYTDPPGSIVGGTDKIW